MLISVKSSKDSLSQNANFDIFFKSVIPIFGQNSDKGLKVVKTIKEFKFEEILEEL